MDAQKIKKHTKCKSLLVALEGIDGSGKTSVSHALAQALKDLDLPVMLTKEPGGTPFGLAMRSLLHDRPYRLSAETEFLLFAADRAQHMRDVIKPALEQNSIIISDRMADSSLAYQGYGRGISLEHIQQVNQWVMADVKPNLVFYLKIDYKTALNRMATRTSLTPFEKEQAAFFLRVINGFDTIFKNRPDVIELDATASVEQLVLQARDAICVLLAK
jgi:dTMP kinase